ncbi:WD40 repeat-like protein [Phlegmacium glaucopus]|nr:WD40 repeat-like protein [Phlegmacium glaucopus]
MDIILPYKFEPVADLPGHVDRAWHLAWNPKKPFLASCSTDKTVRLYSYKRDPSTRQITFTNTANISTGHSKTVRAVAWAPSGETLATASFDANIGIWEQERDEDGEKTGGEWECMSTLEGHETECKSVAYSSTGTLLATCSRDKTVWVWEVHPDADFECITVLMEHKQDVKCVAWHPTEEILASCSYDDTIKLYIDDPSDDWFCFSTLEGHASTVWSIAWSPKGNYLASASDDKTVRIWKRIAEHKWACVLVLSGHERSVYSVSWCKGNGKQGEDSLGWLASASGEGSVRIWELLESKSEEPLSPPSYRLIGHLQTAHGVYDVNCVVWCPRKGYEDILATSGDDGSIRVWRVLDAL